MSDQPTKLIPCQYPECGSTKLLIDNFEWLGDRIFKVFCLGCGAHGPHGADSEEAVTKWNSLHQQAADAERYRWLKKQDLDLYFSHTDDSVPLNDVYQIATDPCVRQPITDHPPDSDYSSIDAAIDVAMKQEQEGNSE